MKKLLYLTILVCIALLQSSVQSQDRTGVKDIDARLSPKKTFEETKIAVDDVRYVGIEYITRQDSIIMRNCGVILRNDLDFSPLFEAIAVDSFYLKHMEIKEMTITAWKWLGARYLVKLEIEFPRGQIKVSYRLYSVDDGREIKKGNHKIDKKDYRKIVHRIANEIVKFLTGDQGIFETQIIYSKKIDTSIELFMSDYDGKNERQLTSNSSINILPSVTPDGENIYFTSYVDGRPKIYTLNLKSNAIDLISGFTGLNTAPAVSPDGKMIACVLSKDGNSEIYLLNRKGKIERRLTNSWAIETSPTWSPDGKMLAFTSDRTGTPQIYVMDSEGFNVRRLTFQGNYNDSPNWSPDGKRIVFASRNGGSFKICSIDVNGKNWQVLTEYGGNEAPYVSPDGKHVVFASNRLGQNDIYTMDIFGGGKQRITNGGDYSNPIWMPLK